MKSTYISAMIGIGIGLSAAVAGAQTAGQTTQHQHPTPKAQTPAPEAMKGMDGMRDMHAMMADPAMRQKMMTNMAQCRDMMSMMMEHMRQEGKKGDETTRPPKR